MVPAWRVNLPQIIAVSIKNIILIGESREASASLGLKIVFM